MHISTANTRNGLANVYARQGNYQSAAAALYHESLNIQEVTGSQYLIRIAQYTG